MGVWDSLRNAWSSEKVRSFSSVQRKEVPKRHRFFSRSKTPASSNSSCSSRRCLRPTLSRCHLAAEPAASLASLCAPPHSFALCPVSMNQASAVSQKQPASVLNGSNALLVLLLQPALRKSDLALSCFLTKLDIKSRAVTPASLLLQALDIIPTTSATLFQFPSNWFGLVGFCKWVVSHLPG